MLTLDGQQAWNFLWIDGEKVFLDETFDVLNPATGEVVGRAAFGGEQETKRAIDAASRAFPAWAKCTPEERAAFLLDWAERIQANSERLAYLLSSEQGKPLAEAKGEFYGAAEILRWYANEGKRAYGEILPASNRGQRLFVFREPVGVVGLITPMNFPGSTIFRKIAPALAAGCTVVLKPAEKTPLTALAVFALLMETGIPKGVANLVTGNAPVIADTLLADSRVRKLSFTGSTAVGKLLMEKAANNLTRLSLELGGVAPAIVFPDTDLEQAAEKIVANKFENAGQVCNGINYVYVHESIQQELTDQLVKRVKQITVGIGTEDECDIGPLIDFAARDKVESLVEDAKAKGAQVLIGGCRLDTGKYSRGSFYAPTVLTGVTSEMELIHREIFGPVVPIMTFRDEEEVIEHCNRSPYGLAAYVFTRDSARIFRMIDSLDYGMVAVNGTSLAYLQAPFGGVKLSGMGREGGYYGLDEYLEMKYAAVTLE